MKERMNIKKKKITKIARGTYIINDQQNIKQMRIT